MVLACVICSLDYSVFALLSTTVVTASTMSCLSFHTSIIAFVPKDDDE